MESKTYRKNEKILPFKFNPNYSTNDINKKFLNITNSSNEFNDYMFNFYKDRQKHIKIPENYYICKTESSTRRKKEDMRSKILNLNSLKDKQILSNFFTETKHQKISSKLNENISFKTSNPNVLSKCDQDFQSETYRSLKLLKELPVIKNDKINFNQSPLLTAETVLRNAFEIFYRKETMPEEIVFSSNDLKLMDVELCQYITSLLKEYSSNSTQTSNFILSENINKTNSTQSNIIKYFNPKTKHEITITLKPAYLDFQGGVNFKTKMSLSFKLLTVLALLDSPKQIEFLIHIIEYNHIFKTFSINEDKAWLAINNMHLYTEYNSEKIISQLHTDKLKHGLNFTWLYMDKSFQFKLFPAKIEVFCKNKNSLLTKILDKDLLIFLVSKNFSKWEFYTLNNLILTKKFRNFVRKISQIQNNKDMTRLECLNMDDDGGYKNPPFTHSTESIQLILAITIKEGSTYVLKLSSYYVNIVKSCHNYKEIYEFNLRQSRILLLLSQYINVFSFLRKIFFLDKKEHIVKDVAYLDFLDEDYINKLKNYSINTSENYDPRGLIINLQYYFM
jgi:hypothetical protein